MKRYYDKLTHTEVRTLSEHTIKYGTGIIDWWFSPLAPGEKILYWTDDMPYKYTEDFMKPIVEDGEVVEGITQEELDQMEQDRIKRQLESQKIMLHNQEKFMPSGWAICDGKNGTPDLTNEFLTTATGDVVPYIMYIGE